MIRPATSTMARATMFKRFTLCVTIAWVLPAVASGQSATDPCANLPAIDGAADSAPQGPEPTSGPGRPSAITVSQQYIRCGLERFRTQDFRQAVEHFEIAYRAAPSADLRYNIARARELMSEFDEAAADYERYLRDRIDAPDRADVEARVATLRDLGRRRREAALRREGRSFVAVSVDQPGASIRVDGRPVGDSPLRTVLEVSPGMHRLTVERAGYQRWEGMFRGRPGDTGRADVALSPETRYRTLPAPHLASVLLGSLGGASLAAGIGIGTWAGTQIAPVMRCPSGQAGCDPSLWTGTTVPHVTSYDCEPSALTCGRDGLQLASALAISAGIGLGTGALIAWFIEAGSGRTERLRSEARPSSR